MVIDALLFTIVAGSIHEASIDEDTILWALFHLAGLFELKNLKGEGKLINSDLVLTGVSLETTSHETLREEHATDPVGQWATLGEPVVHKLDTADQIFEPGGERFERGVSDLLPVGWHDTVSQTEVHGIESFTHDDKSTNSLNELIQRFSHQIEKFVELLHLLDQDSGQGR